MATFSQKFWAWWHGIEREEPARKKTKPVAPPKPPALRHVEPAPLWTEERKDVCQRLWGQESIRPGGAEYTLDLAKPLALNSSMSVMDLSAGLGGGTRLLAQKFQLWMSGMEPDQELARAGMELSHAHEVEKKAPIRHYDPNRLELTQKKYDALIMREVFYRFKKKEITFKVIASSLKKGGHLVLTDFVLREPGSGGNSAVREWIKAEPEASPLDASAYRDLIKRSHLALHIQEDRSEDYASLILSGWKNLVNQMSEEKVTKPFIDAMFSELSVYSRLVTALESGDLLCMRYHATSK